MNIRVDIRPDKCRARITNDGCSDDGVTHLEVDIRVEGDSLVEVLAAAVDRFQELQQMCIAKMREVGLLNPVETAPEDMPS